MENGSVTRPFLEAGRGFVSEPPVKQTENTGFFWISFVFHFHMHTCACVSVFVCGLWGGAHAEA